VFGFHPNLQRSVLEFIHDLLKQNLGKGKNFKKEILWEEANPETNFIKIKFDSEECAYNLKGYSGFHKIRDLTKKGQFVRTFIWIELTEEMKDCPRR